MERIRVDEAARLMGVSSQFVRVGLQRGTLPIGHAVKLKRWVYYISKPMLEQYVGIKKEPVETGSPADDGSAERTITRYHNL